MIHLDTSFLIDLLRESRRQESGRAATFLNSIEDEDLCVSVHVLCELFAGAELAQPSSGERLRVQRLAARLRVAYPDERFAPTYAALFVAQKRTRQQVATMDLLIATEAVVERAPLVTRDTHDFSRIPGLEVRTY